jgi:succinate-semialdehyde dehydrogenase / glutarate-semialdehyde dehydrogenase
MAALDLTPDPTPAPDELFVNGTWSPARRGATFEVENPATGAVVAHVADGDSADAQRALLAAATAQPAWAATSPRHRSELLYRAYAAVLDQTDRLARLITLEMGKPLPEALGEVAYAADYLRWYAEEAVRTNGDATVSGDGKTRITVTRRPVGPTVLVTPWNFPIAMATRKIAPAIAAGCTMLFKPADLTPLTSLAVTEILREVGLPPGVLNVVTTKRPGEVIGPWLSSPITRKVTFTGSTAVGKILLEQAAGTVMRTSMELGGNAALIVCADADMDEAVNGALLAKMRNGGQACTAANRILVHASRIEEFLDAFTNRMAALRIGDGFDPGTDVGPMIDARSRNKTHHLVEDAISTGARVLLGGTIPSGNGYFYPPTVLTDVAPTALLLQQEIFGPVAPVISFDSDQQAIEIANTHTNGLVSYVFSRDINRAHAVNDALDTGMVGINTGLVSNVAAPFGGIKESGLGREGGRIGIDDFLDIKYAAMPVPSLVI